MKPEEFDLYTSPEFAEAVEANLGRDPLEIALDRSLVHARDVASRVKTLSKARAKLPSYYAARCLFTDRAYQQSSGERAAMSKTYRGELCIDLTCGLGVDSFALSRGFSMVVALEPDPLVARVARYNFGLLGVGNVEVVEARAEDFIAAYAGAPVDLVYADPDRRDTTGRRFAALEDCSPDILSLMSRLRALARRVVVKLSPLFDVTEAVRLFGPGARVVVISDGGECKEVLVELGVSEGACGGSEGAGDPEAAIGRVEEFGDSGAGYSGDEGIGELKSTDGGMEWGGDPDVASSGGKWSGDTEAGHGGYEGTGDAKTTQLGPEGSVDLESADGGVGDADGRAINNKRFESDAGESGSGGPGEMLGRGATVVARVLTDGAVRDLEFRFPLPAPEPVDPPPVGEVRWLVVPEVALVKTGAARAYYATKGFYMHSASGFAFGDNRVDLTDGWLAGRTFKATGVEKYVPRRLKTYLKERGIDRLNILLRDFPDGVAVICKQLGIREGGSSWAAFTVYGGSRYCLFLEDIKGGK